jgi:beta-lactamase regulating signal transducer with metallopeptidase domain
MSVHMDWTPTVNDLSKLAVPALRSLLVAATAAGALAALRVSGARLKLTVWRSVLCVALAMPVLSLALPPMPVSMSFLNAAPAVRDVLLPVFAEKHALEVPPAAEAAVIEVVSAPATKARPVLHAVVRRGRATTGPTAPTIDAMEPEADLEPVVTERPSLSARVRDRVRSEITFARAMAIVYVAGFGVLAARMITGIVLGGRLARKAKPIHAPRALHHLHGCHDALNLRVAPRLAESAALSVPVTFGVSHPAILLPVDWNSWSDAQLDSVLLHELSHVARRDALTERLSLVHRALFWFSPLSWWLDRELAKLAEQASDEAALASGIDREQYAETLLGFFTALHAVPGRVRWQGVSMAASGQAEKRVERILHWTGGSQMTVKRSAVAALVALAVPVVCFASALTPKFDWTHIYQESAAAPAPPAAPAKAVQAVPKPSAAPNPQAAVAADPVIVADPHVEVDAVAPAPAVRADVLPAPRLYVSRSADGRTSVTTSVSTGVSVSPYSSYAPQASGSPNVSTSVNLAPMAQLHTNVSVSAPVMVQVAPVAPMAPIPPVRVRAYQQVRVHDDVRVALRQQDNVRVQNDDNTIIVGDLDGMDEFAIVSGKFSYSVLSDNHQGETFTTPEYADGLRKKYGDDFIWFKRNGQEYVIRDAATVARAKQLFDNSGELSRRQSELGAQQEALGKQQEQLSMLSSNIEINMPDMSDQMNAINDQMKAMQANAAWQQANANMQKSIDDTIAKLDVNSPEFQAQIAKAEAEAKALNNPQMKAAMDNLQKQLEEMQERMGNAEALSGERAEKLGKLEEELGQKEAALGEKEAELGRQQEERMRKDDRELKSILDQAIANGTAKKP